MEGAPEGATPTPTSAPPPRCFSLLPLMRSHSGILGKGGGRPLSYPVSLCPSANTSVPCCVSSSAAAPPPCLPRSPLTKQPRAHGRFCLATPVPRAGSAQRSSSARVGTSLRDCSARGGLSSCRRRRLLPGSLPTRLHQLLASSAGLEESGSASPAWIIAARKHTAENKSLLAERNSTQQASRTFCCCDIRSNRRPTFTWE